MDLCPGRPDGMRSVFWDAGNLDGLRQIRCTPAAHFGETEEASQCLALVSDAAVLPSFGTLGDDKFVNIGHRDRFEVSTLRCQPCQECLSADGVTANRRCGESIVGSERA